MDLAEKKASILEKIRKIKKLKSKVNLLDFMSYMNPSYTFSMHHKIICERLSKLPFQSSQRIMIFVPPQYGKSEIVSRHLPVWLLGHNPDNKIILASYSSTLADTFNRAAQKLLLDYKYKEIFPTRMTQKYLRRKQTQNFFETDYNGYLYSVGIGGSTTGRSANVFICDDPIKDMIDAGSPTMRQRRIEWFQAVAQTRLTKDGHIIVMHTRWHESDLAGQLLADPENQWEIISLPALGRPEAKYRHPLDTRKHDEPLWPEMKGDFEKLSQIKKDVGERVWSALYQQEPKIEGGNIIKESWFRFYTQLPISIQSIPAHKIVQSWDLTFKDTGSSYVVGVVLLKHDADFYVLDFFRAKADAVATIEAIRSMTKKYPNASVLIEDKANGPAIISLLKREISRMIPIRPMAGKDERLHVVAPLFEAGNVHLPTNAPWTKLMMSELQQFPNSENDDIVDAVSQGLQHFSKLTGLRHLEAMTRL